MAEVLIAAWFLFPRAWVLYEPEVSLRDNL